MFEIEDSDGEVYIKYKGEGREWLLGMMQEEEAILLSLLLERAGGIHNLALEALMAEEDEEWEKYSTPCPGCGTICSPGFEFCNRCSDLNSDER